MTVQNCFRFLRNQPKAYNLHYQSLITFHKKNKNKSQVVDSVCNLNCGTINITISISGYINTFLGLKISLGVKCGGAGIKYGMSPLVEKVGAVADTGGWWG